jgi:hypothetical protein
VANLGALGIPCAAWSPFPCSRRYGRSTVTHVLGVRAFGTQLLLRAVERQSPARSPTPNDTGLISSSFRCQVIRSTSPQNR